jgi:hypothetical protein
MKRNLFAKSLKIEVKKIRITIPAQFTGKAYGVVSEFKQEEEWLSNGDLVITISLPSGMLMDFSFTAGYQINSEESIQNPFYIEIINDIGESIYNSAYYFGNVRAGTTNFNITPNIEVNKNDKVRIIVISHFDGNYTKIINPVINLTIGI